MGFLGDGLGGKKQSMNDSHFWVLKPLILLELLVIHHRATPRDIVLRAQGRQRDDEEG